MEFVPFRNQIPVFDSATEHPNKVGSFPVFFWKNKTTFLWVETKVVHRFCFNQTLNFLIISKMNSLKNINKLLDNVKLTYYNVLAKYKFLMQYFVHFRRVLWNSCFEYGCEKWFEEFSNLPNEFIKTIKDTIFFC